MAPREVCLLIVCCIVFTSQDSVDKVVKFPRVAECGRPNTKPDRIVGGIQAGVNEFPWQAWIQKADGNFGCGGTLINDQWVLTAAQCVFEATECQVVLGAHYSNLSIDEPNRRVYDCNRIVVHPEFLPLFLKSDVALIELSSTAPTNDHIRSICLPPANYSDHVNDSAIISGWGYDHENSTKESTVLRKTNVTILPQNECYEGVQANIFCSSGANGRGICTGDRGGPLSIVENGGTFTQIGILSFYSAAGCESGYPNGITRIRPYLDWILNQMEQSHTTMNPSTNIASGNAESLFAVIIALCISMSSLLCHC